MKMVANECFMSKECKLMDLGVSLTLIAVNDLGWVNEAEKLREDDDFAGMCGCWSVLIGVWVEFRGLMGSRDRGRGNCRTPVISSSE